MGVCASKMQSLATTIDRDAVEYAVRERRVEIGRSTESLAASWQSRISAGERVDISPAELLPLKDISTMKLHLDSTTPQRDMLKTALYVSTNTIYRNQLKDAVWPGLAEGMKKNGLPAQVIQHGKAGAGPIIDMALDKQVEMMLTDINNGTPLVNAADVKSMQTYEAKHKVASQNAIDAAPAAAPATTTAPIAAAPVDSTVPLSNYGYTKPVAPPEIAPMPFVKSSLADEKPVDSSDINIGLNEKDTIGRDGLTNDQRTTGQYEQNQSIRV